MELVYKILRESEWREFNLNGEFFGSKDDLKDGFIHLAIRDQISRIVSKYFQDEKFIHVATFDTDDFSDCIKWEKSASGLVYPHLYERPLLLRLMKNSDKKHTAQFV